MRSTFRVKVTWLQASDIMPPLGKNIYLIAPNSPEPRNAGTRRQPAHSRSK